ncbi:MAG: nucleotidyl transferase AbiEii/AbiGii toxin family protein [Candidatus Bathyarchaeia archaeon]
MSELNALLIHGSKAFSKEELSMKAEKHGFTQPQILELFAWDYELTCQLQRLSESLVLKGGAAAQLYLPTEIQRGSVDVDLITGLNQIEIGQLMDKHSNKFERFKPYFQFRRYSPKTPKVNVPMNTYDVMLPSVFQESCSIKLDVLTSRLSLPTVELRNTETFAIKVSRVKALSLGALIGDKLLTLAKETIGIMGEENYPKQIYDVEMLTFKSGLTEMDVKNAAEAIEKIVAEESEYRKIETTPRKVLQDVEKTMEQYSLVDMAAATPSAKRSINNFQQFYVNKMERQTRLYEWSCRALRIKFLAAIMQSYMAGEIQAHQAYRLIQKGKEISSKIRDVRREALPKIRGQILAYAETHTPQFKELKGKPLERILWHVLTLDNLDEIERVLE